MERRVRRALGIVERSSHVTVFVVVVSTVYLSRYGASDVYSTHLIVLTWVERSLCRGRKIEGEELGAVIVFGKALERRNHCLSLAHLTLPDVVGLPMFLIPQAGHSSG